MRPPISLHCVEPTPSLLLPAMLAFFQVRALNWTRHSSPSIGSMVFSPKPPLRGDSYTLRFARGLSSDLPLGGEHSHTWSTAVNSPSCFSIRGEPAPEIH